MVIPNDSTVAEGRPRVSVVICTRNRSDQLSVAFDHWKAIDASDLAEMVVVDNGSTDATADVVRRFVEEAGYPVLYVYEPMPGLSRARNAGIKQASGEVITFTDDDCYPDKGYVSTVASIFKEQPDTAYVGGRVLLYDESDLPVTIQVRDHVYPLPPYTVVQAGIIHGANVSLRKAVVSKLGNFDVRLGAGTSLHSAEDTDFIARASWLGFDGCYDPRPVVYHHHGRKKQEEVEALRKGYAIGRGAYYMKFLLNSKSRSKYIRFWLRRFKHDFSVQRYYELQGALKMLGMLIRKVD